MQTGRKIYVIEVSDEEQPQAFTNLFKAYSFLCSVFGVQFTLKEYNRIRYFFQKHPGEKYQYTDAGKQLTIQRLFVQ